MNFEAGVLVWGGWKQKKRRERKISQCGARARHLTRQRVANQMLEAAKYLALLAAAAHFLALLAISALSRSHSDLQSSVKQTTARSFFHKRIPCALQTKHNALRLNLRGANTSTFGTSLHSKLERTHKHTTHTLKHQSSPAPCLISPL